MFDDFVKVSQWIRQICATGVHCLILLLSNFKFITFTFNLAEIMLGLVFVAEIRMFNLIFSSK